MNELSNTNNLIAVQELWLRPDEWQKLWLRPDEWQELWLRQDECDKRSLINNNFDFPATSGMKEAVAYGIIRGRAYGGVAFLWHISLNKYIQVLQGDDSGRCLAMKMQSGTKSIVINNICFPCFELSCDYRAEISFDLEFMKNILNTVVYDDIILIGDTNVSIDEGGAGFQLLKSSIQSYSMLACDT